jgi:transposase
LIGSRKQRRNPVSNVARSSQAPDGIPKTPRRRGAEADEVRNDRLIGLSGLAPIWWTSNEEMSVGKKAKQYTREFVARAVRLCDASNRPVAEVARDLGIEYATLWGWMKKAGKTQRRGGAPSDATTAATPATPAAMAAELDRLRRELEEVKLERDFLKKAAVSSTGRRYTCVERSRWGAKAQGLAWALVELPRDLVQLGL